MEPDERLRRKNEFDGNLVCGARQFNQVTGRDHHLKQRDTRNKKAQFIDPATGTLRKDYSVWRSCPVCGAQKSETLFLKEGFSHVRCLTCSMVYVNPVLAEEPLNLLYREEDSYRQVKENELQKSMDRKRYLYGLDLIEEYAPNKGSLLDIGCGTGLFLQTARERGWQVSGIEPNTWCYNHIMQMGIDVINTPIEQVEIPADSFDCITMWTVLEHIVDPAKILKSIHRALRKDGVLLVVVPNVDALANRILHEKSTTFAGESHVNLFSPATLTQLLQTAGFSRIHCETALSLLGTINNYLSYESPQFGNGTAVLDFLTPEYIHTNLLGYVLFALARVEKP